MSEIFALGNLQNAKKRSAELLIVFFISCFLCAPHALLAQVNTTAFGFVVKPIFPSEIFRTGPQTQNDADSAGNSISFGLAQNSGFSVGGIIRKGITKNISFETGISYVNRKYQLDISDTSTSFSGNSDFTIVGYEIPIQVLVFVQLSQQMWMNASLGTSLDIFPSDVETRDSYFIHKSIRESNFSVFSAGLIANIGWEYRTEKDGIFYIGGSYHRSFNSTYRTVVGYYRNIKAPYPDADTDFRLKGDYLTLDLRYYFHADPNKKKKKKK